MEGRVQLIHSLFDQTIPIILKDYHQVLRDHDDILKALLLLVHDYAEHQMAALSQYSATTLYVVTLALLTISSSRLQRPSISNSSSNDHINLQQQNEQEYRSDIVLLLLQLLNHLSTKDFSIDDEETVSSQVNDPSYIPYLDGLITSFLNQGIISHQHNILSYSQSSFVSIVSKVLVYGMTVFIQLLSADFLRSYPTTCNRYFSFISFLLSVYQVEFASELLVYQNNSINLLQILSDHLLWGAGMIDTTVACMAFQCIQTLATFQYQSIKQESVGFPDYLASAIFRYLLERVLHILLFPNASEYGMTWDRLDSCSHAFITLIALDPAAFYTVAQSIIISQSSMQQELSSAFQSLSNDRGVDVRKIDRQNRQLFLLNMKDFYARIRPLMVYNV